MKVVLSADPRSVGTARDRVAEFLAASGASAVADPDDVVLAVSELVTNAVKAHATAIELELRRVGRALELAVQDDAPGWPVPEVAAEDATHGRGLAIVAMLATSWDVIPVGSGKRVVALFEGPAPT